MREKSSPFFAILVGVMLFCGSSPEAAEASQLPLRRSVPVESRWSLEDIYPSDGAWRSDFDRLKSLLPQISAYQGTLGKSADNLFACLSLRDEIGMTGEIFLDLGVLIVFYYCCLCIF